MRRLLISFLMFAVTIMYPQSEKDTINLIKFKESIKKAHVASGLDAPYNDKPFFK